MSDLEKTTPAHRAHIVELLRFVLVGVSAVATDFCVYFAIIRFSPGFSPSIAKALSFIAGACISFVANRGFVFRAAGRASQQVLPFTLLYLVSLGLNNAMNYAALALLAPKFVAWFLATGTSTVSSFIGMKFIVFKKNENAIQGSTT